MHADETLWGHFLDACNRQPDAPALRFDGETILFGELCSASFDFSQRLQNEYGIKHGDRVVWMGLNHPSILIILFACARLGAIFTPLNSRLTRVEYQWLVDNCEPAVIVHDLHFMNIAETISSAAARLSIVNVIPELRILYPS